MSTIKKVLATLKGKEKKEKTKENRKDFEELLKNNKMLFEESLRRLN